MLRASRAALASAAVLAVVSVVAGSLGTATVAPFTGTLTSDANRVATGAWTAGNLRWWGSGGAGQSGQGDPTATSALRAVAAPGGTTGWKRVTVGASHVCGIASNDTLWCWGDNSSGQLGTGSTTGTATPTQVSGGGTWTAVDTETDHTCAVRTTGTVHCWGRNDVGQLGTGTTTASTVPVQVAAGASPSLTTATAVAVGERHSCVVRTGVQDGLWCWGAIHEATQTWLTPMNLSTGGTWTASISAGGGHTCAVRADSSTLYCWGRTVQGQVLADPATAPYQQHPQPAGQTGVTSVVAGTAHTCVTTSDGAVRCAGSGHAGQLGPTTGSSHTLVRVGTASDWAQLASTGAGSTVCARTTASALWCWGENDEGQIGTGGSDDVLAPVQVSGLWQAVAAGGDRICAIATGAGGVGALSCSGSNAPGTPSVRATTPVTVGLLQWSTVAVGKTSSCGVDTSGALWCWGVNTWGGLGQGDTTARWAPTRVGALQTWRSVVVGNGHACATRQDGTLWCWGRNADGQLGVAAGDTTERRVPTQVPGTWTTVVAAARHTCALATAGTLHCWGDNAVGQLGTGTTTDQTTPAQVTTQTWTTVATGAWHTCGVQSGGGLYCWGAGGPRQLLSVWSSRTTPTGVSFDPGWTGLAVGDAHACGTRSTGAVRCWGNNEHGQLGRATPSGENGVADVPGVTGATRVVAGARHTCALTSGAVTCWGDGVQGQVGTGGTADAAAPTTVTGLAEVSALTAGHDTTFAVVGSGGSVAAYRAAVAEDVPSGTWRLDETTGTVAAAATGSPAGTYTGLPSLGRTGALAGSTAVGLDGVDDAVVLTDTYDFTGTTAFTVEAWVRRTATTGYPRLIAKTEWPAGGGARGWGLLLDAGTGAVVAERYAGTSTSQVASSARLGQGTWHHVAATYDGATLRVYVDGAAAGSVATTLSVPDSTAPVTFGGVVGASGTFLAGDVDEVAIYSGKALSAARLLDHHTRGRG